MFWGNCYSRSCPVAILSGAQELSEKGNLNPKFLEYEKAVIDLRTGLATVVLRSLLT